MQVILTQVQRTRIHRWDLRRRRRKHLPMQRTLQQLHAHRIARRFLRVHAPHHAPQGRRGARHAPLASHGKAHTQRPSQRLAEVAT